jgi:hypothetical protein
MVTKEQQLRDELLKAAIAFLEHEEAKGHSLLVNLTGGAKLGIELELLPEPGAGDSTPASTRRPLRVA